MSLYYPFYQMYGLVILATSELAAKSFTSDAADDQSLFRVAKEFLRPVYRTTVYKFQSLTGSGCRVDVKTEIRVVSSALRSTFVKSTIHAFKFRANH